MHHYFTFDTFRYDTSTHRASFSYSFDDEIHFTEEIDFFVDEASMRDQIDPRVLDTLLFHLSLALGISYYKLSPTRELRIRSGVLDEKQIRFWHTFYLHGLGEFFYRNQIDPRGLLDFRSEGQKKYEKIPFSLSDRALVPMGGGKDSIVTCGILEKQGRAYDLFTFGKHYPLHDRVAAVSGRQHYTITRKMDPLLFDLSAKPGYSNGHVPITGIIAFVLQVVSYLYDYRYNILSNEKSANIGNLEYAGYEINHQYSKSEAFEKDFTEYTSAYMSDIEYSSILRPYYEIEIARRFAQMKPYFPVFSSCNNNFKIHEGRKITNDRWCLECPKCAFVFSMLRPFITDEEMITIFGRDLYDDDSLLLLFQELLGYSGHKPFECVGTNEEVILAFALSVELYEKEGRGIPIVLEFFRENILSNGLMRQNLSHLYLQSS